MMNKEGRDAEDSRQRRRERGELAKYGYGRACWNEREKKKRWRVLLRHFHFPHTFFNPSGEVNLSYLH
uniref:Uncharacterized protein n=1 Tax=Globodera rostochiensis TaxID=31243 RepID=A0A914HG83_GLORO